MERRWVKPVFGVVLMLDWSALSSRCLWAELDNGEASLRPACSSICRLGTADRATDNLSVAPNSELSGASSGVATDRRMLALN